MKGKERVGQIEKVALKHILPYVKQIARVNLLYDAGNSNLVLHDYLKGWDGVEVKGRFKRVWTYLCL